VEGIPAAWRRRLVIENDERVYSTEDILAISRRTGLPVVFDNLHDRIHSGHGEGAARFLDACFRTWDPNDGPPKDHYSAQAPGGRPGEHADWAVADESLSLVNSAPPRAFDRVLEVKRKDLAPLELRQELGLP
jgi:UV DNA damage endonuclease